jgi:hypothetical protein
MQARDLCLKLFWIASLEIPDFFTGPFIWRLVMAKKSPQCPERKKARKRSAISITKHWHSQSH